MTRRLLLLVAGLAVALGLRVFAQVPQPAPVFRAGVDLVPVDVVVTDAQDRPITGLTPADFTLTQDGRPQTIAAFQYIAIPVAHRVLDPKQPPAPPSDVATNAPASDNSRLFVMIVDDQHIIENDIAHVKDAMAEFVRALSPDDQVAMVFVGRSDLSVNFTSDTSRLLKAVDGVRGALGLGTDAKGADPSGKMSKYEVLAHAETTLFAMKNATLALSGSGHVRRAIVLVSGFSPLAPPTPGCDDTGVLQLDLVDAYEVARRADVPIYTLDPRGIPSDVSASRRGRVRTPCTAGVAAQQAHLVDIAASTGGRALINRLDVAAAVDEIVADNGSFYLLGYSPDPAVRDGKAHSIKVTVARPGARVRGRTEYVAQPAVSAAVTSQQMLDAAIARGVDVSGLTLHAFAAPVSASAKGMATVVTVDVTYPVSGNTPSHLDDDLRINILALDPDAKVKTTTARDWHVQATAAADRSVTVRVNEVVDLPTQPLTLRIGVASSAVGRAGTIQLPVDVPNPMSGKIQLGAIVLGLASPGATPAAGFDRIAPLIPFQPTTTRAFTLADTVRVFVPVFWNTKDPAAEAMVTFTASRGSVAQDVSVPAGPGATGHHQAAVDVSLALKDVAPGPCTISVSARLVSGGQSSRTIPCVVEWPK